MIESIKYTANSVKALPSVVKQLAGLFAVIGLASCGSEEVNVQYKLEGSKAYEVIHNGYFSTISEGTEQMGTVTKTWLEVTFEQSGEQMGKRSIYKNDASRGYHKNSFPAELIFRGDYTVVGKGYEVSNVRGLDEFGTEIVDKLVIPDRWKTQLKNAKYPMLLKRREKKRWEWAHLLEGPVPKGANITELVKRVRPRMPIGVQLDSVTTYKALRNVEDRKCLEYTVFYSEKIDFPRYLWEQWAYSTKEGKAYKNFRPDPEKSTAKVEYTVLIEPETGLPCREKEIRTENYVITEEESGSQAEFTAVVHLEDLYTEFKDEE